jgi:hypothetical protein
MYKKRDPEILINISSSNRLKQTDSLMTVTACFSCKLSLTICYFIPVIITGVKETGE